MRNGQSTGGDLTRSVDAFGKISKAPIFFEYCIGKNINQIQSIARRMKEEHGIKLVIVDYMQKIRAAARHEKRRPVRAQVPSDATPAATGVRNTASTCN
jgi:replicative DNA helicase